MSDFEDNSSSEDDNSTDSSTSSSYSSSSSEASVVAAIHNSKLWTIICDFNWSDFACGVLQDQFIVMAGGSQNHCNDGFATIYDTLNQSCTFIYW